MPWYIGVVNHWEDASCFISTGSHRGFARFVPPSSRSQDAVPTFDYGKTASYWARAQMESAPASNPPKIGLVSMLPDKPTIASLNQFYESALRIAATMWRSSAAGFPHSVLIPEEPPLLPLQDARDPQFAKLVAMRAQVNKQIQAVLVASQEASLKATEAAARMGTANPCAIAICRDLGFDDCFFLHWHGRDRVRNHESAVTDLGYGWGAKIPKVKSPRFIIPELKLLSFGSHDACTAGSTHDFPSHGG